MFLVGVKAEVFNRQCMGFPQRLRALREGKGWSQGRLGDKIDVTWQTVSRWELGKNQPKVDELVGLAKALGVTVDQLVGNTEPPAPAEPVEAQLQQLREVQQATVEELQQLRETQEREREETTAELRELRAMAARQAAAAEETNELLRQILLSRARGGPGPITIPGLGPGQATG